MQRWHLLCTMLLLTGWLWGQAPEWKGKFEQLGPLLPTPNNIRTGAGAPGPDYWQMKADYDLKVVLDDELQQIHGTGSITYHNKSPHTLEYIWLQLDQNIREEGNHTQLSSVQRLKDSVRIKTLVEHLEDWDYEGGMHIQSVTADEVGLPFTINRTMMRVDLPEKLLPGKQVRFELAWWYNINDRMLDNGRSGFEFFPEDSNYLYTVAQFYPRMAVYDDYEGWQNKQFLGDGEFALPFGDFTVEIDVPADHLVAATGELKNSREVLTQQQQERWQEALTSFDEPMIIASEKEAKEREGKRAKGRKIWKFEAENVRDFAFASSRKFIWDAQAVQIGKNTTMAMSFYPKEGNPLWELESTKAVRNALGTYSKYTIDYPYPVAISVHTASLGMEYPMISFNYGRPDRNGNYSRSKMYRMIGVIIHEIGHNFFPMIINTDERQWAWMDEGLNCFVQYLTEQENYENFPSRRGPPKKITAYMASEKNSIRPIMTNPEQLRRKFDNAYSKPATALNILRESILGHELFDRAFKIFAERWAFKHPKPADFFRTMEDASGTDLDWFWKGWFYTVDHVDIALKDVKWKTTIPPDSDAYTQQKVEVNTFPNGPGYMKLLNTHFYLYGEFMNMLDEEMYRSRYADKHFYELELENKGGLVMPVILDFHFVDGTSERVQLPAEVWRYNEERIVKIFAFDQPVHHILVDPDEELADVDMSNNIYPSVEHISRLQQFREGQE